ncbi:MAG TPA: adenosylmethionine--8-amino-7-oxononanoate transaminase [Porticoccus sp.]|nr:adenosylmethionine--8-amino-7-oxononanoate transaminase [Porticoccus sp.]
MTTSQPVNCIPMEQLTTSQISSIDQQHIWHPYSSLTAPIPAYHVASASGVRLKLADGRELIDGMSSWWSAIHGYNHPTLNIALKDQVDIMSHVMFGGIIHEPAAQLCKTLVDITPDGLEKVFLSDSGSVSVEVALKMAIQYWYSLGQPQKTRILSLRKGYHGDTFGAMSVCDPVTGMHHLFSSTLAQQLFTESPRCRFHDDWDESCIADIKNLLEKHSHELAAVILEPILQGTGGMHFYSPTYLKRVRELCDEYDVLLIVDEIATGFGRTGKLFGCEWADITPDILCLGKAMTGGYMTLAATLCTSKVSDGICNGEAGVFMHGPTFMGNPLACSVANASIDLLLSTNWQARISDIEQQLKSGLAPAKDFDNVTDVRCLGAVGVIETKKPVDVAQIQKQFVAEGIWVRPFGTRVYVMPPYIISESDLDTLMTGMLNVVKNYKN